MPTNKKKISAAMAKKLAKIYYTPSQPASFSSVKKLWMAVDRKIPKKIITEWLQAQETYTLHKQARLKFPRNNYIVTNIDDLWECDLAEFSQDYSTENNNMKYLLG